MNKKRPVIGLIGFGIVGRAIQHGFAQVTDFRIYDINPNISENTFEETIKDSDYIFICVPTQMKKDGEADISIVEKVLIDSIPYARFKEKILIIKSTIPPGTTRKFIEKYRELRIVFNPEFLTARNYKLDFINTSRIILAGNLRDMESVEGLYRLKFPHTPIIFTDTTTAEMAKYTANTFFCSKLAFFNEIYDICEELGISYDEVMKMVLLDGRIGNSHYSIPGYDGDRGFGGTCFPKDLNALIYESKRLGVHPIIMNAIWEKNLKVRKKYDWII